MLGHNALCVLAVVVLCRRRALALLKLKATDKSLLRMTRGGTRVVFLFEALYQTKF